jgi:hypothetical protein
MLVAVVYASEAGSGVRRGYWTAAREAFGILIEMIYSMAKRTRGLSNWLWERPVRCGVGVYRYKITGEGALLASGQRPAGLANQRALARPITGPKTNGSTLIRPHAKPDSEKSNIKSTAGHSDHLRSSSTGNLAAYILAQHVRHKDPVSLPIFFYDSCFLLPLAPLVS